MRVIGFWKCILMKTNTGSSCELGREYYNRPVLLYNNRLAQLLCCEKILNGNHFRDHLAVPGFNCNFPTVGIIKKSPRSEWPVPLKCV